jgi:integrase
MKGKADTLQTPYKRRYRILTDAWIQGEGDFRASGPYGDPHETVDDGTEWDSRVIGLRVHFGRRRIRFSFYKQNKVYGKTKTTAITLGYFPAMKIKAARTAALVQAGMVASGHFTPGQRSGLKVAAALDQYITHLRENGKAGSRWAENAASLVKVHIKDDFGNWPMHELSAAPAAVADWHKKIAKKSPVAANHAARLLRAAYKHVARLDRALPPHNPTSAVHFIKEARSQAALAPRDFPKWRKAWEKIESPTRQAFQKIGLLCGARPGELARVKWSDVLPKERVFVIRGAKAENDIRVVMSLPIVRELQRAKRARVTDNDYVFPARAGGHIVKFDADALPAWGMMYRRTWRTIAADLGIDELQAHFMLGHVPAGVSRGYVAKMMLASGQGMRTAQRRVSAEIERRLGFAL